MVEDVAVEDVSAWKSSLDDLFAQVAGLCGRIELRRRARSHLVGLLAPVERKNSWQLAEAAGLTDPWRVQHFLGRVKWSADAVRDVLRSYAAANLAGPDGVLVVDETCHPKRSSRPEGHPAATYMREDIAESTIERFLNAYLLGSQRSGRLQTLIDRLQHKGEAELASRTRHHHQGPG